MQDHMKPRYLFHAGILAIIVCAGCATYSPSHSVRTIPFSPKVKSDVVLEAAIEAAQASKLPAMSNMDKANGVVEFGAFGTPEMGLTAQARVRSDNQVEITVKRGSMFVPIKAESPADTFKTNLLERLEILERKAQ